jgi:hypothetical protein
MICCLAQALNSSATTQQAGRQVAKQAKQQSSQLPFGRCMID